MVEHQEVHARRQQDVERVRRLAAEVRRDVNVRIRTVLPRGATAVQVGEPCPGLPQRGSRLRHHLCCPGFIHTPSLADHRDACLLADARALRHGSSDESPVRTPGNHNGHRRCLPRPEGIYGNAAIFRSAAVTTGSSSTPAGTSTSSPAAPSGGPPHRVGNTPPNPPGTRYEEPGAAPRTLPRLPGKAAGRYPTPADVRATRHHGANCRGSA